VVLDAAPTKENPHKKFAFRTVAAPERPLSSWQQDAAYDTAAECENGRQEKIRASTLHMRAEARRKGNEDPRLLDLVVTLHQLLNSACIASDDPRLKP
jgi:hypothetical protein